mmetsp:Transcript_97272/g.208708  ORF Transcript_97272/g.208708 Transcript_97272/m.208708 type:complete len:179 (+) Transcript_97272:99-635(+)|eukprot:CAMPEP_0180622454 /NCGR_PEP_ID=MMETSP1037_2-20121125/35691_1 /TAXON_ID=632150 /ORGANISM="Azadinium spinosum, Strain 3D9" /LENGTH=178 /DNA_ID=CAMNT_0022642699 /DNA_START=74 /DNA_END=610 /DNA_ORIENTATION=-
MFFVCELETYVLVKPQYCGPGYSDYLEEALKLKVESTVIDGVGLVIAVETCSSCDNGKIQEGTALILVPMKFRAIVLQLFKNEVVDCEVVEVNKLGFFGEVGPVRIFVSKSSLPMDWKYSEEELHLGSGASYVSPDKVLLITRDAAVRVRIVATKQEDNRIMAIGTTNGDFLGPVSSD